MTSKNTNYTHQLYNTVTSLIMCLIRDIRTNRYYDNIIITLLYNYYNGIGILLKKGLILPILKHHRRKAHTEIVGFSIVAVCQMRDEAIHPASLWELEHLAFFISKKHRRNT